VRDAAPVIPSTAHILGALRSESSRSSGPRACGKPHDGGTSTRLACAPHRAQDGASSVLPIRHPSTRIDVDLGASARFGPIGSGRAKMAHTDAKRGWTSKALQGSLAAAILLAGCTGDVSQRNEAA